MSRSRVRIIPKRHRGQNFLVDKNIVRKIADAAKLTKDSIVLEVGPGTGTLTEELITRAGHVIAVEIDKDLFAHLQQRFADAPNLTLIKDDILDVDVASLHQQVRGERLEVRGEMHTTKPQTSNLKPQTSYSIISNLPYNITSRFFRKFLESDERPERMVVMMQKEVAERMRASPPDMNLLALSVQFFADIKVLFPVSRTCFSPKPRVDSAVVELILKNEETLPPQKERQMVFRLARAGFSSKRKYCASNISRELKVSPATIHGVFEKLGLSPKVRAQEISLEQWKTLCYPLHHSAENQYH